MTRFRFRLSRSCNFLLFVVSPVRFALLRDISVQPAFNCSFVALPFDKHYQELVSVFLHHRRCSHDQYLFPVCRTIVHAGQSGGGSGPAQARTRSRFRPATKGYQPDPGSVVFASGAESKFALHPHHDDRLGHSHRQLVLRGSILDDDIDDVNSEYHYRLDYYVWLRSDERRQ